MDSALNSRQLEVVGPFKYFVGETDLIKALICCLQLHSHHLDVSLKDCLASPSEAELAERC